MDAIITAGGIPKPGKPLYEYTQGIQKAFLEINGKPLLQYALDAIGETKHIERVVLVSIDENSGVKCKKPLTFVPHQGGMLENIRAGAEKILELNPVAEHVLIGVSDSPLYDSRMIDWAIEKALETKHDAYYYLITREVFETRFPNSNREYVWMKNTELTGGTLGILTTRLLTGDMAIWEKIVARRKSKVKGALTFGIYNLIKFLLRNLSIEEATALLEERMGISGRAIFSPYAELAFDIDNDNELKYLRRFMAEKS